MSKTSTIARMRRNGTLVGVKPYGGEEPLDVPPLAPMSEVARTAAFAVRGSSNEKAADHRFGGPRSLFAQRGEGCEPAVAEPAARFRSQE